MNKLLSIIIASELILGITSVSLEAAAPKVKTYRNCTELNKVYKGGVSRAEI